MSIFNYKTKKDSLDSLRSEVAKIKKCLKALKFWEVNDTQLGDKTLRRRKVTPSPQLGVVGRGAWYDVNGLERTGITDDIAFDWSKCSFGYKVNPDGDNKAKVRIYVGSINRNASAQTDLEIKGTVETSVTKYVYARVTVAAPSTILITSADSVPADDATYNYYSLYRFTSNLYPGSSPAIYIIDDDSTIIDRPFNIEEGVSKITAGTAISIDPVGGRGNVTVNNNGVTQIVAGTLIAIDPAGGTGSVTINGTAELPASATQYQVLSWNGSAWVADWVRATA